ncbi:MAG: response regulator [Methyloglobulus sp.]|jgi:two-component system, chemotaxis family, chemotaxis protein CheY|nr:response regulator [Methyloglobulus sp.]
MAKTIMIVDDSASMRQVIGIALKDAGYDLIEAGDGKEALSKLDGTKIHLIVSDINMPNMDGITFVKEVKQLAKYRFTPIIMLTTEVNQAKKDAAKEAGAKAWVTKPFQPKTLLEAVSKLILP